MLQMQALEQSMEGMRATLKALRQDIGAKDAELAITKAEAEAFRRQLIPHAGSTLSADTEVSPRCRALATSILPIATAPEQEHMLGQIMGNMRWDHIIKVSDAFASMQS